MKNEKKLYKLLKGHYRFSVLTAAMAILPAIFTILASLNNTNLLQNIIDGKYDFALKAEFLNILFWSLAHGFYYLFLVMQNKCVNYALVQYRSEVAYAMSMNDEVDVNFYNSALNNDVARVEQAIRGLFMIFDGFVNALCAILALIYIHWLVMLFSVLMFAMNSILPKLLKKRSTNNEKELSRIQADFLRDSTDNLNGYSVWDAYNVKNVMCNKIDEITNIYERRRYKLNNMKDLFFQLPFVTNMFGQAFLMAFDVLMILYGQVLPGSVLTVGQLAGTLFNNVTSMFSAYTSYVGYQAVYGEKVKIEKNNKVIEKEIQNDVIKIQNLSFSYQENNEVLKNFNQTFKEGKKYLILGQSGCGKSTLLNLIFKDVKGYEGEITLGNIEYNALSKEQVHNKIGYIKQQSYVFEDSIEKNILLGRKISKDNLSAAKTNAKLEDMNDIAQENAKKLSGGQIQRVCLARELCEYHSIVLLDEVANAVDENTAKDIYHIFLQSNRTVIAVAHYLPEGIKEEFDEIIYM